MKFIGLFLLVFCISCSREEQFEDRFGGKEAMQLIATAESVIAWRTDGSEEDLEGYYRKAGNPIILSPEIASRTKATLVDPQSYPPIGSPTKACAMLPGVIMSFVSPKGTNDVYFCFECAMLAVKPDGKELGSSQDFDPSYSIFVEIVKSVFPKDDIIQVLGRQTSQKLSAPAQ